MKQRKDSSTRHIPVNRQSISDKPIGSNQPYESIQTNQSRIGNSLEYQNANNGVRSRPVDPTSKMQLVRKSENGCNNGCRYAIGAIVIFFGICIVLAAILATIGQNQGYSLSGGNLDPGKIQTSNPTYVIPSTTVQQTWKPVVTVAKTTTNMPRYIESPTIQSSADADWKFKDTYERANGILLPILNRISYKIGEMEFYNLGSEGSDLRGTALAAIDLIEPLSVSPSLSESKRNYLLALKSFASAGDAFSQSERSYNAGDGGNMAKLVIAGKNRIEEADKYIVLSSNSLPVGYK
ncbi:MAG: hypothetical protein ABFC38_11545 [Methanospirillum sp.]